MPESRYWQHNNPIDCPKGHQMIWSGSVYWLCCECHQVYVQVREEEEEGGKDA